MDSPRPLGLGDTCNPPSAPDPIALKPGDAVCWAQYGRSSARRREGHLVSHLAGGLSRVRISKGKVIEVVTTDLAAGDADPLRNLVRMMAGKDATDA